MKYATARPYADPEKAARRILEIANAVEPIQGRIHIEKINEPFLFRDRGSPAEYGAGLKLAIDRGWLKMHESGTFVTFTPAGAELFALNHCQFRNLVSFPDVMMSNFVALIVEDDPFLREALADLLKSEGP